MLVDFQQHYTPPELLKGNADAVSVQVDQDGNPNYLLNPLLADLASHIRVMDQAGIDAAVLSCGSGFDQPDLATCRLINDRMREAEKAHPGRFIGLAHVPALKPAEAAAELKRCAVDLGLYDLASGKPVEVVSGFDEFSDRAFPDYLGGTSRQRWHRDLLRRTMEAEGFTVYENEWWHYDFKDWQKYPILNQRFEDLAK